MKSIMKIYSIICSTLLVLSSCEKNSKEYEILNDFIHSNNIEIACLQDEPFCFKNLYLNQLEKKALNINVQNDFLCNHKIEIDRLKGIKFQEKSLKSQISYPIYSNDKKYIYIIVSYYNVNKINFYKSTTLYKLKKINNHWKVIDEYKTITQS